MTMRSQNLDGPLTASAKSRYGDWLWRIDAAIDWRSFNRFLDWLEKPDQPFRHETIKLFKAFLIAKWCSLSALEFNHEIEDRRSFREFVGLNNFDPTMTYSDVSSFQALLVQRSIAAEIFAELDSQVRQIKLELPANVTAGLASLGEDASSGLAAGWLALERKLTAYWQSKKLTRDIPLIDDIRLADLKDIEDNLILIRVLPDGEYQYEMVGQAVEEANQGRLVGFRIKEKADTNLRRHDEQGLQKDLKQLFDLALSTRAPVSADTYFLNAKSNKCKLFTAQAPLVGVDGRIEFLLGVASIKPIVLS